MFLTELWWNSVYIVSNVYHTGCESGGNNIICRDIDERAFVEIKTICEVGIISICQRGQHICGT